MKHDTVTYKVVGGVNQDYESCENCAYADIPEEACKVMGCIHSMHTLRDWYTEDEDGNSN